MSIESDYRKIFLCNNKEIIITETDKEFLDSHDKGIIYRQETGGLSYIVDSKVFGLPATMFTNLRWGYQLIDTLKTFKVLPDNEVKIVPWIS